MNTLKIEFYDNFKCIADRCSLSCCQGWDIAVDKETLLKWNSDQEQSDYFNKYLKTTKSKQHPESSIKMGRQNVCPFVAESGLCNIVINYGDDYLSKTCKTFPRLETHDRNLQELSLSCACPEVIDFLNKIDGHVTFLYEGDKDEEYSYDEGSKDIVNNLEVNRNEDNNVEVNNVEVNNVEVNNVEVNNLEVNNLEVNNVEVNKDEVINVEVNNDEVNNIEDFIDDIVNKKFMKETDIETPEFQLREIMIELLQNEKYTLKDRILQVFHLLLTVNEEQTITTEVLQLYQNDEYLQALTSHLKGAKPNALDSLRELRELFLDITQNYSKVANYRRYLQEICESAEELEVSSCLTKWSDFQIAFQQYEKLMEHCIVTKIFAINIKDKLENLLVAFQMIVTEYVVLKFSSFQRSLKKELSYIEVREDIVLYSRIIGYNSEGMKEFWEDSFDEAVWDIGYILMLMN